jgi:hypothetical protein
MTSTLAEAMGRLAGALAEENARLRAMDLAGAAAMLTAKQEAAAAFEAARAGRPAASTALREAARRLRAEVEENRRLLLRAIEVQKRVIGIVAGAGRPKPAGRYGRTGGYAAPVAQGWALSARA